MGIRRHDLARAMALALETPPNQLTPQVQQEVVQQCELFVDSNLPITESESAKLGEDLVQIYKDAVMANPAAEVLFLQCMSRLAPCLVVEEQVRTWVDLYSKPAIDSAGQKNDLVRAACDLLVAWMVPRDGVEGNTAQYQAISRSTALFMVQIYLHENLIVGETKGKADAKEERLRFVRMNAKNLILKFAEERPQEFCVIANRFFVQPEYRVRILVLLSAFFSQTRAKIPADLARSQLVKHLFACLLNDKSSQVVTMAASALIMMLPFICSKIMTDLPYLFAVYGRMVCWRGGEMADEEDNQELGGASDGEHEEEEEVHTDDEDSAKQKEKEDAEKSPDAETDTREKTATGAPGDTEKETTSAFGEWQPLARDNVPDAPTPDWERMFTFLYGLFPSNFIMFLRKPTEYISATLTPPDDWDDYYISQRSKICFDRHLLHVQLLTSSSEQELKDEYRWAGMTPADIASLCLSLLTVSPTERSREDNLSVSSGPKEKDKEVVTRSRGTSLSESKRQFSITSIPDRESTPSSLVTTSTEAQVASGELLSPTLTSTSATGQLMDLQARHQSLYGRKADGPPSVSISTLTLDDSDSQGREDSPVSPLTRYQKHSSLGGPSASIEGVLESGNHSSPAMSPAQLPVGSPILRGDSSYEQADILAYYQRELLLIKNELDFVCYLDYHNQFRIRQLKEQLHSALRQDIDVQNLVTSNQKLKRQTEQLNSQLDKMKELGNTLRTQKVQHEGTLTKRNRELRLQCDTLTEETAKTNLEFEHMQAENQRLYAAAMTKEAAVTQLELKVEYLENENRLINEYRDKLKTLETTESSSDSMVVQAESQVPNSDLQIELEKTKIDLGVLKHEKETLEKRLRGEIAELEEQMANVEKQAQPSHKVLEMLETIKQEAENRYHQLSVSHQELSQRYQDLDERFRTYAASSEAENLSPGAGELFNNTNQKSLLGYDVESIGGSSGNSHRTTKQSSASLAGSDSAYYRGVPIGGNSKTPSPAVEHLGMNFGGSHMGGAAHIPHPQPPSHSHSASQDEDSMRPRARGRGGWQNAARKSEAKKINSFRGFL
ncbi:Tuberous sclerosis 1 protein-like protein [Yarrowia sp. C11]|nr:Tuberous sclerosis 1 protein-like protein [Yarrowia sp. E02]KAG5371822.1 Tuberous sclerosis 1 protein-like protein [Yarrowia sp. C11]